MSKRNFQIKVVANEPEGILDDPFAVAKVFNGIVTLVPMSRAAEISSNQPGGGKEVPVVRTNSTSSDPGLCGSSSIDRAKDIVFDGGTVLRIRVKQPQRWSRFDRELDYVGQAEWDDGGAINE